MSKNTERDAAADLAVSRMLAESPQYLQHSNLYDAQSRVALPYWIERAQRLDAENAALRGQIAALEGAGE